MLRSGGRSRSRSRSRGRSPISMSTGSLHQRRYGFAPPTGCDTDRFTDVAVVPGAEGDGADAAGASSNVAPRTFVSFPRTTLSLTRRPAGRRRRA